jgi:hypothetical protein
MAGVARGWACRVRIEVPLSAEIMVAALFAAGLFVTAQDVTDDSELFGLIAQVVERDGTASLEAAAKKLPALERSGRLPRCQGHDGGRTGWRSAAAA